MSGPPRDFSGREIVSVLTSFNYRKDRQRWSHAVLTYNNPTLAKSGPSRSRCTTA